MGMRGGDAGDATVSFWYVRGNFVAVIFGLQYTGSIVPGFVYLFVLIIWDDWKRREGGDVLIQDWNLKLQSFNLNSIPVSSFFSCYLFNFCHWCKREKKRKRKFEKMPGVGSYQGEGSQKWRIKYSLSLVTAAGLWRSNTRQQLFVFLRPSQNY